MSASTLLPKRDEVIRFRAESDLKSRLAKVAARRKKKPAEFMREKLWAVVEAEEAAMKK